MLIALFIIPRRYEARALAKLATKYLYQDIAFYYFLINLHTFNCHCDYRDLICTPGMK